MLETMPPSLRITLAGQVGVARRVRPVDVTGRGGIEPVDTTGLGGMGRVAFAYLVTERRRPQYVAQPRRCNR